MTQIERIYLIRVIRVSFHKIKRASLRLCASFASWREIFLKQP